MPRQEVFMSDTRLRNGDKNPAVRFALIAYALSLYVWGFGLFFEQRWATRLWPFSYNSSSMSYALIASILAAAGTSIICCAVAREYRALTGVGINAAVITLPVAIRTLISGG